MCGIFGMIGPAGLGEGARVAAFRRLYPRGPDDRGVWADARAVVGMTRLAIVDVCSGHQPMLDPTGRYVIVFNGEIYNHVELRQELEQRGHVFRTHSDTEVLLALFVAEGERALLKLNGIFAFAVYDRAERTVFLARDRLGIKPLFLHHDGKNLHFASNGAVLDDWLHLGIDRKAVLSYLAWSYVPEPKSIYARVTKLPAGTCLWSDGSTLQPRCYWQPAPAPGTWRGTVEEAKEQLDTLLADALRLQIRSDVPIGICLSGGVDSSAVLHYARRALPGRIRAFTIAYEEKGGQDLAMARLVAAELRADCEEIRLAADATPRLLAQAVGAMDEPFADTSFLPTFEISRVARAEGVKVLLGGAGGDEIFGGYSRHWPAKPGRIRWFAEGFAAAGLDGVAGATSRRLRTDKLKRMLSPALTLTAEISGAHFGFLHRVLQPDDFGWLMDDIATTHAATRPSAEAGYHYARMLADVKNYLVNDVLAIADQGSMGASIEARVPLLDHRLVEFAFELPPAINLLGGRRKGLFRELLQGKVPSAVLTRPKEGFNAPTRHWVQHGLREGLERLLAAPAPVLRDALDLAEVRRWTQDPRDRRAAAHTLYALIVCNDWCAARRR